MALRATKAVKDRKPGTEPRPRGSGLPRVFQRSGCDEVGLAAILFT